MKKKTRYDLLEPFAIDQLARVFSKGSEKYDDNNWLLGMKWTKMLASLKRHIAAFEQGEDFDKETELYHMAHAAWNAMALVSYYKHYPQGDDRLHTKLRKPRISVDIDDVCCDFIGEWCKLYNMEKPTSWYFDEQMRGRFEVMIKNGTYDDFLLQLPTKVASDKIGFDPVAYVTARTDETKKITEEWLRNKGFPLAPVYCTNHHSKLQILKDLKIDIHIDDSYPTFVELNANGICCFLFDAPHNSKYDVGFKRIYNLNDIKW